MAIKHIPDGGDFEFPSSFGFKDTSPARSFPASGDKPARNRPWKADEDWGEGYSYAEPTPDGQPPQYCGGGRVKKADGGTIVAKSTEVAYKPGQGFVDSAGKPAFGAYNCGGMVHKAAGGRQVVMQGRHQRTSSLANPNDAMPPGAGEDDTDPKMPFPRSVEQYSRYKADDSGRVPTAWDSDPQMWERAPRAHPPIKFQDWDTGGEVVGKTTKEIPDLVLTKEMRTRDLPFDEAQSIPTADNAPAGYRQGGRVHKAHGGDVPMRGSIGVMPVHIAADVASGPKTGYRDGGKVKGYAQGGVGPGVPSGAKGAPMAPGVAPQKPGAVNQPSITMPLSTAKNVTNGLLKMGQQSGARQAVQGLANAITASRQGALSQMRPGNPGATLATAGQAPPAPDQSPMPAMKKGGHMPAATRNKLPSSDFAGPDRSYPINDAAHARNALSRVAQHGSPALESRVRAAVHRKFPSIGEK